MSERADTAYLQDIVISIEAIEQYLSGISEEDFAANQMIQDAVIRRFEIIGEAATQMTKEFKDKFPVIEWRLMTDMRNKLIHGYFGASASLIYETSMVNLPELKIKLQAIPQN